MRQSTKHPQFSVLSWRGENTAAWLILATVLAAGVGVVVGSVAGAVASFLSGQGWRWVIGWDVLEKVVSGQAQDVWPGTDPRLVAAIAAVLLAAVVTVAVSGFVLAARRDAGATSGQNLARRRDVEILCPRQVRNRALRLRPSLRDQTNHKPSDYGVLLGDLLPRGPELRMSWEDCAVWLMPPRAGKTTAAAVNAIIDAPGSVIVTSNKADVLAATIGVRRKVGRCWVFDPQQIAFAHQDMWWDPLESVRDIADAHRLAAHFMQELGNQRDFWASAAAGLLGGLIMAAACSSGTTMRDVWTWLNDSTTKEPVKRLHDAGMPEVARGLEGRQGGAWETREGIYETARTAAQCLQSEQIMRWITPPSRWIPALDLRRVAMSRDTLYLLSKEDAGAAQPLVAALVDEMLRTGERIGEEEGGRMDPPMLPVLDEAANICKIRDLPKRYSHCGSRGIPITTILQNYEQGKEVWGENGMNTLWSAATIKVIGGGIDDARFLGGLADLVGRHDVTTMSRSRDPRGGTSESANLRLDQSLPADEIRALPAWQGLLLATRCRVALIRLRPWFETERAQEIGEANQQALDELTERAKATRSRP